MSGLATQWEALVQSKRHASQSQQDQYQLGASNFDEYFLAWWVDRVTLRGRFSFESIEEGMQKFHVNAGVTDMVVVPESEIDSGMGSPSPMSPEESSANKMNLDNKGSSSRHRRRAPADLRRRVRAAIEGRLKKEIETQSIDMSDSRALVRQNLVSKLARTLLDYCQRAEYGQGKYGSAGNSALLCLGPTRAWSPPCGRFLTERFEPCVVVRRSSVNLLRPVDHWYERFFATFVTHYYGSKNGSLGFVRAMADLARSQQQIQAQLLQASGAGGRNSVAPGGCPEFRLIAAAFAIVGAVGRGFVNSQLNIVKTNPHCIGEVYKSLQVTVQESTEGENEGESTELCTLLDEIEGVIQPTDVQNSCMRMCTLMEAMSDLRPDYDSAALKKEDGKAKAIGGGTVSSVSTTQTLQPAPVGTTCGLAFQSNIQRARQHALLNIQKDLLTCIAAYDIDGSSQGGLLEDDSKEGGEKLRKFLELQVPFHSVVEELLGSASVSTSVSSSSW